MTHTTPLRKLVLPLALPLALSATGCESTDPCVLRTAACVDVSLLGKKDPVYYRGVTVRITDAKGGQILAPIQKDELRSTALAGVQDLLTFQLPESFNNLPDNPPQDQIKNLDTDTKKIEMLKSLRTTDPRAIQVTVEATEVNGAEMTPVKWSTVDDEGCFSSSQWLQQKYYRVGKNQYAAVYAWLLTSKLCEKPM